MIRILVSFILFFLFASPVFAVSITLSDYPSTISSEEFSVNVNINGAKKDTTNYLKIDLYKDSTSDYFGYTQNGSSFYNTSEFRNYPLITINTEGSASAQLTGKVDVASSKYKGQGEYKLRVRRYTGSGSYSTQEASENAVNVRIGLAQPPTPTPTIKESSRQSSTPTPTKKPVNSNKTSPVDSESIALASKKSIPTLPQDVTLPPQIMGEATESSVASISPTSAKVEKKKVLINSETERKYIRFIVGGVIFIVVSGILFYSKYKRSNNSEHY